MIDNVIVVIYQLLWMVNAWFFYQILCCLMERRKGKVWTVVTVVSAVFVVSMVIFPNDAFNVTMSLIWFLALMLIGFKGKISAKIAVVLLLFPLIIAQNFLVGDILGTIYLRLGGGDELDNISSIIDVLIHIGIWYFLYRLVKTKLGQSSKLFDDKTWRMLSVICIASLVSIVTFIYFAPKESWKVWLGALGCMVTNIGSLYLAGYFVNSIQMSMEQKNLKLQQSYYLELQKNQDELRRFRHDLNNQLSVIKGLIENNEKETAGEFLHELENHMSVKGREFCNNGIVNALLNDKYNYAIEENIDCFFHISLPNDLMIDPISLCSIFANTLDNAIEASLKFKEPEKRKIEVRARIADNGYFSYEIENRKCTPIHTKKGQILTDKDSKQNHGIGLGNVREVVDKYGGMMDVSYTEETFRVVILIENAKK